MLLSQNQSLEPLYREPYMSPRQLDYFRRKLLAWRDDLVEANRKALVLLNDEDLRPIEEMERSIQSMNMEITLITRARNWHLIQLIDQALERINDGSYGYCEASDEPIGFARLDANPVALYCLGVQEELEKKPSLKTRYLS